MDNNIDDMGVQKLMMLAKKAQRRAAHIRECANWWTQSKTFNPQGTDLEEWYATEYDGFNDTWYVVNDAVINK